MKKFLLTLPLCIFVLCQSAFAALPPLWQGAREMTAILKSEQLSEYFTSGEQIQEIKKEGNFYLVSSATSACIAEVIYLPPINCGPAQFKLEFKPAAE